MNSFWKNRTVFVTGATGFVGAHIVRQLLSNGAKVVALQRDNSKQTSLDILGLREKTDVITGALDNLEFLSEILKKHKIDSVFHLAAQALVGEANRSPIPTFETNIRGTYFLLEACRQNSTVKSVIVASSDKAYGSHKQLPYQEDFSLRGLFPYDVSKTCTDLISQSFAQSYDLPVSIVRAANIYGEADLNLSRIIPGTIISILKDECPIIRSDGTPIREFIHIDDIVAGYLLLAENIEDAKGEAYNLGTNEPVQMLDLVNKILILMDKFGELPPQIMLKTKIAREIDAQYLSTEKISQKFGWNARISLDKGLRKTIEWYRNNLDKIT